jgi:predicted PurR-regulated permease PerM
MTKPSNQTVVLPLYLKLVVILAGIILLTIVMREAKSILFPIMLSCFLAILVSPITARLEKHKVPKALATLFSLIFMLLTLTGIIYFFYVQSLSFSEDFDVVSERFAKLLADTNLWVNSRFNLQLEYSGIDIRNSILRKISQNMGTLSSGIISTAGKLTLFLIIPVYLFLFIYYRHFLVEFIMKTFDQEDRPRVRRVITKIKLVTQSYFKGVILVMIILAVLNSIALISLGIEHAVLFAVFAAVLNIIPFVGPIIGSIFPAIYALLTKDSLFYPVAVIAAFYIIQLMESNIFTPGIVGKNVSMNPLMTIIALFIGSFIWGLEGMILFIPGMAILKVIFDEVDGLQPYGFLLGALEQPTTLRQAYFFEEWWEKIRKKWRP